MRAGTFFSTLFSYTHLPPLLAGLLLVSLAMLHRTEFGVRFSDPSWEPCYLKGILTPKRIINEISALEELISASNRTIDSALDTIFATQFGAFRMLARTGNCRFQSEKPRAMSCKHSCSRARGALCESCYSDGGWYAGGKREGRKERSHKSDSGLDRISDSVPRIEPWSFIS